MAASVLFVCDDNSILGPMAEAFVKRHGWSTFMPFSAGIIAKPIHRFTFRVMEEIGYDLYGYAAKSIFEFNHLPRVDFLITLSDQVNENYVFNENHIGTRAHWSFRNPIMESTRYAGSSGQDTPIFDFTFLTQDYWVNSDDSNLAIRQKQKVPLQVENGAVGDERASFNVDKILKCFRRTRDELEVQVMNWLEEQGVGPLWWKR